MMEDQVNSLTVTNGELFEGITYRNEANKMKPEVVEDNDEEEFDEQHVYSIASDTTLKSRTMFTEFI